MQFTPLAALPGWEATEGSFFLCGCAHLRFLRSVRRVGIDTPGRLGPDGKVNGETPRTLLPAEVGDLLAAITFATGHGLLDGREIFEAKARKLNKLMNPLAVDNLGRPLAPQPDRSPGLFAPRLTSFDDAQAVADDPRVLGVYLAPEWDELDHDGQACVSAIVAVARGSHDTLSSLRRASIARQVEWADGTREPLPVLFKATELGGEAGEVLNVIKKLERERLGWNGSRATVEQLGDELADLVICADLLAEPYGIDLGAAIIRKFNATSEQRGLTTRMGVETANDALSDLVERFSAALLDKLRAAEAKYRHGDAWARPNWRDDLCRQMGEHLAKGDPRDVAAYAAFAWHHGWSLEGVASSAGVPASPPWGWHDVAETPVAGGVYLFGGYVTTGPLGRRFERGLATLIRTVDGPEWTIRDPQWQHIPIEWWTEAGGPHPEHVPPSTWPISGVRAHG